MNKHATITIIAGIIGLCLLVDMFRSCDATVEREWTIRYNKCIEAGQHPLTCSQRGGYH